jgi:ubiquinone/menaquinone biosynthesis C-methylase UbiE
MLPFPNGSIDVVYTCVSLTHVDYATIGKVMAEIGRVARRHVLLCEVDERPMQWRNKLRVINIGYFFLHRYEKLAGPALKLLSITPLPDLAGHPRYTLFQFAKTT